MHMPIARRPRRLPASLALLFMFAQPLTAHAQQVACDPRPVMPENAVSGAFDAQAVRPAL